MRKRRSANKSPHVERDYLRAKEANAVIEALVRPAGSGCATRFYCG